MPNSYSKLYVQCVFAVKYRQAMIEPRWRSDMMAILGYFINQTGCKALAVNGVADHVHLFFRLRPALAVADVMRIVKANSSRWANQEIDLPRPFRWQTGYGVFSYSRDAIPNVCAYIQRQEIHHAKVPFRKEYINLLTQHGVDYDERDLFHDPL